MSRAEEKPENRLDRDIAVVDDALGEEADYPRAQADEEQPVPVGEEVIPAPFQSVFSAAEQERSEQNDYRDEGRNAAGQSNLQVAAVRLVHNEAVCSVCIAQPNDVVLHELEREAAHALADDYALL